MSEDFSSNSPRILFLTGASGVGKTSIVTMLAAQNTNPDCIFQHADTDGVACLEGITEIEQATSIEQYQEIATHKWIEKVALTYQSTNIVNNPCLKARGFWLRLEVSNF
jgi:signal recognition particle GTPase